jgi:hypothetical protein
MRDLAGLYVRYLRISRPHDKVQESLMELSQKPSCGRRSSLELCDEFLSSVLQTLIVTEISNMDTDQRVALIGQVLCFFRKHSNDETYVKYFRKLSKRLSIDLQQRWEASNDGSTVEGKDARLSLTRATRALHRTALLDPNVKIL